MKQSIEHQRLWSNYRPRVHLSEDKGNDHSANLEATCGQHVSNDVGFLDQDCHYESAVT